MKNKLALLILVMFSKPESLYSTNKNTESLKLDIVGHERKKIY